MTTARVVLDPAAVKALLAGPNGPVVSDIRRRGNRVLNRAKENAPVDTGNLRGSLSMEVSTVGETVVARVGTNVPYALPVHERFNPFLRDALDAAK